MQASRPSVCSNSSSTSRSSDLAIAVTDQLIKSSPEYSNFIVDQKKVARRSPGNFSSEKVISSSEQSDNEDQILNDASVVQTSCEDYASHATVVTEVDVQWITEGNLITERVELEYAKFTQETISAENRNKHLPQYSDLSLSLGLRSKQSFSASGLGSPLFAMNERSVSLPCESDVLMLAQQKHTDNSPFMDEINKASASRKLTETASATAQLTIFYDGNVHIYNDLPQDKAKAIFLLAESENAGSSQNSNRSKRTLLENQIPFSNIPCHSIYKQCSSSSALISTVPQNAHDAERLSAPAYTTFRGLHPAGNVSYAALPQARRTSLKRFLKKRTERAQMLSAYAPSKGLARSNQLFHGADHPVQVLISLLTLLLEQLLQLFHLADPRAEYDKSVTVEVEDILLLH